MTQTQGQAKRMTAALKRELVPALKARGFTGKFPRYRRERPTVVQFLAIFYDKAATHFFLEFGAHERSEKLTSWGELVPENKLLLEHVRFEQRARLQARCGGGSIAEDGLRLGHFVMKRSFMN